MADNWKPMRALPLDVFPSRILVWNECNGTSEIEVDDIDKLRGDKCWRLWRDVPKPTEKDIERAMKTALSATRA